MLNTNKTKKVHIKHTTKNITKNKNNIKKKKINQKGGKLESITREEYDKRLDIERDNTYLKTILCHHFDSFGNFINIKNQTPAKKVIINEPLVQNESFLEKYNKVFELLNQEYTSINFEFTFNIRRQFFDWNVFDTNEEFIDLYNSDIGRNTYITKQFKIFNFEKSIKDGKPYNEILTKDNHCIDCSEDFVNQINTENSKIRNGFKLLITQRYPLIFLSPFNRYDQSITNQPQIKKFSFVNVIVNNCIHRIVYFEDMYKQDENITAGLGYLILKYDPGNNHNLSIIYYSTNKYFDLINSHLKNTYTIMNPIVDKEIFKKKVLIEIKNIITKYNLIKNNPDLSERKLYKYRVDLLRNYFNKYIYFLKV
jgi:hypothetical protein